MLLRHFHKNISNTLVRRCSAQKKLAFECLWCCFSEEIIPFSLCSLWNEVSFFPLPNCQVVSFSLGPTVLEYWCNRTSKATQQKQFDIFGSNAESIILSEVAVPIILPSRWEGPAFPFIYKSRTVLDRGLNEHFISTSGTNGTLSLSLRVPCAGKIRERKWLKKTYMTSTGSFSLTWSNSLFLI